MARKSLIIASIMFLLAASPTMAERLATEPAQQSEVSETHCYVTGQNVRVQNGSNQMLEVYNITGVRVASFRIDSEDITVSLNLPKGIYILKVGKFVRKISLR